MMEIPTAEQARRKINEKTVGNQLETIAKAIDDAIKQGDSSTVLNIILMTDVESLLSKRGYILESKGIKTTIKW